MSKLISIAKDLFEIAEVSECSSFKPRRFKTTSHKYLNPLNRLNEIRKDQI
jgi:hypothetical protein